MPYFLFDDFPYEAIAWGINYELVNQAGTINEYPSNYAVTNSLYTFDTAGLKVAKLASGYDDVTEVICRPEDQPDVIIASDNECADTACPRSIDRCC